MLRCMSKHKISPFLGPSLPIGPKKRGAKYLLQRTSCVGLFARQKCAFFENHGSTVFGRYLSIRSCAPGVFCQVLWIRSGMLGVGCGEQWQLGSKQTYKAVPGGPRRNSLFRWKGTDREIIIKTQSQRLTKKGSNKSELHPRPPAENLVCRGA